MAWAQVGLLSVFLPVFPLLFFLLFSSSLHPAAPPGPFCGGETLALILHKSPILFACPQSIGPSAVSIFTAPRIMRGTATFFCVFANKVSRNHCGSYEAPPRTPWECRDAGNLQLMCICFWFIMPAGHEQNRFGVSTALVFLIFWDIKCHRISFNFSIFLNFFLSFNWANLKTKIFIISKVLNFA